MRKSFRDQNKGTRGKKVGRILLGASLGIWAASTAQIYVLSAQPAPGLFAFAVWGGVVAGLLGALRSQPSEVPNGAAWFMFNLTKSFVACGILFFLLQGSGDSPMDQRWVSFFYGMIAYMTARDVMQTVSSAILATSEIRRKEQLEAAKRAKLLAHAEAMAKANPFTEVTAKPSPASAIQML